MAMADTHKQMVEEMGHHGHSCISQAFLPSLNAPTLTASREPAMRTAMDAGIHLYAILPPLSSKLIRNHKVAGREFSGSDVK